MKFFLCPFQHSSVDFSNYYILNLIFGAENYKMNDKMIKHATNFIINSI